MIKIELENLSKRYGYQWIIRNLSVKMNNTLIHGITGSNGSGKSTLIKILSGYLSPSTGILSYTINNKQVSVEKVFQYVSLAAPYTDLINEYTLEEMLAFHTKFKPFKSKISYSEFEEIIQLKVAKTKTLDHYSSGMKQKIQLALAILSDNPILLLDEPTSFLDAKAKQWFQNLLLQNKEDRLVIIASNDSFDLQFCDHLLDMDSNKNTA